MIVRPSFNNILKEVSKDNIINKNEAELLKSNAKLSGEKYIVNSFPKDEINLKFKIRESTSNVVDYKLNIDFVDDNKTGSMVTSEIQTEMVLKTEHKENPKGITVPENVYKEYPNLKALGKALKIEDYDENPIVQDNVKDLAKIPEGLLKELKNKGIKQIHIASLSSLYLAKNQDLANTQPRNWSKESTFDDVPGIYEPNDRTVAIGVGDHNSSSLALHETGHAIGALLKLDKTDEMKQHHERLFPKVSDYLKGGEKASNRAGLEETFAEGFATLLKNGEEAAVKKFDQPFVDYLKGILEKYP